ncbi:MAG: hypothetical protein ACXQT2_01415 [Methanotrichaceae archaeon]
MRSTTTSERMKELREQAAGWDKAARTLERVDGLDPAARERRDEADRLRGEADRLRPEWRLQNLEVYRVDKTKTTRDGTRTYTYWHCSWREGDRVVSKYLGSTRRLSEEEALVKARGLKAEALGL